MASKEIAGRSLSSTERGGGYIHLVDNVFMWLPNRITTKKLLNLTVDKYCRFNLII